MAITIVFSVASCGSSSKSDSSPRRNAEVNGAADYAAAESETYRGVDAMMKSAPAMENNSEEYVHYEENSFISTAEHPLSTFSTDVDTASFTNVRRMLENGQDIDPDAVRTEEFINYFKYSYPAPQPGSADKLSINTELSDCPWNKNAQLLLIGLQAQDIEVKDIDSNIVFLIDVSGSMHSANKLPLVQQAFTMLAENLGENDRISIVTYAGSDEVKLEGEKGSNYDSISAALGSLKAGGSTAGAAGINTAYEIAEKYFIEGGNNRVILATDGDLNVGVSSVDGLTKLVEEKRDKGVYLSVLGFGTGNYKDNRLEALADNGNGNYAYIDSIEEARRVLVTEMSGTLFTVAKDAKVQVEFDPEQISKYKLVGYENRLLADKDFEDDEKDAGDIGAGQQVTVLYELIPAVNDNTGETDESIKNMSENTAADLAKVSVRYKERDENESKLLEAPVSVESFTPADSISDNMKLACGAAMFAKTLSGSQTKYTAEQIRQYSTGLSLDAGELNKLLDMYEKRAK